MHLTQSTMHVNSVREIEMSVVEPCSDFHLLQVGTNEKSGLEYVYILIRNLL